jgi:hypothetical protein
VSDPNPATEKIMRLAGLERIIKIVRTSVSSAEKEPALNVRAVMSVAQTEKPRKISPHRRSANKGKEEN